MSWELLDSAHLSPTEMVSMIELVLTAETREMSTRKKSCKNLP
jgi:hypothetical protein